MSPGRDGERGSILVELLFLMVVVTVPLFYLVATLAQAQAGAFAANAAAREAARAFVTADGDDSAYQRASAASAVAVGAHGFDEGDVAMSVTCSASPCLSAGAQIRVDIEVSVSLPLIPDFAASRTPTSIVLAANHVEVVDEFGGR